MGRTGECPVRRVVSGGPDRADGARTPGPLSQRPPHRPSGRGENAKAPEWCCDTIGITADRALGALLQGFPEHADLFLQPHTGCLVYPLLGHLNQAHDVGGVSVPFVDDEVGVLGGERRAPYP
jgi:hypothetical protein